MRSKIAANNSRGTATSAIWKITYPECLTTLAPIFISFSRSVVNDQCFTDLGSADWTSPPVQGLLLHWGRKLERTIRSFDP